MSNSLTQPFPMYFDVDGRPIEDGRLFVGVAGLNPLSNPQATFWDSALTVPAADIRVSGGVPVYNGAPGRIYVSGDYSFLVQDKNGKTIYSKLNGYLENADWFISPPRGNFGRSARVPPSFNFNLILDTGFYSWSNAATTNFPPLGAAANLWMLTVVSSPDGSGIILQRAFNFTAGFASAAFEASRSSSDGGATWGAWTPADGTGSGLDADTVRGTSPGVGGLAALAKAGTIWAADNDGPGSGLDAETVSGSGIGVSGLPNGGTGTGMNATIKSGIYYCNNPVGLGAGLWGLFVMPVRDDLITQQVWGYGAPTRYTRVSTDSGATWSGWTTEWNSTTDGTGSGLDADLLDGQHGAYYASILRTYHGNFATIGASTQGAVFTALTSFVPTAGDIILAGGGVFVSAVFYVVHSISRGNATLIEINCVRPSDGELVAIPCNSGNATAIKVTMAW